MAISGRAAQRRTPVDGQGLLAPELFGSGGFGVEDAGE
jgi:hypothetical protein